MQFLQSKRWPNLAGQGQWPPFSIPPDWIIRCTFGANLVVLAQMYYKESGRQAKFPRILCRNDHDSQDQWPSFSIPAESIPGCILGATLVILAQIYEKLSHGQAGFPSISQSKWPKWPSRSRSMTLIFNSSLEYPKMHVWCTYGDSRANLWWVTMRTM